MSCIVGSNSDDSSDKGLAVERLLDLGIAESSDPFELEDDGSENWLTCPCPSFSRVIELCITALSGIGNLQALFAHWGLASKREDLEEDRKVVEETDAPDRWYDKPRLTEKDAVPGERRGLIGGISRLILILVDKV